MKTPWSTADNDLLTILYKTYSAIECAKMLRRTRYSVHGQIKKLGLRKDPKVAGQLRSRRSRTQGKSTVAWLMELAPEKPTECPKRRMRGVVYDSVPVQAGSDLAALMWGRVLPQRASVAA